MLLRLAGLGSILFVTVSVYIQMVQPAQPFITPVSDYLRGPYEAVLHAAFVVFALSIALFGVMAYRTMRVLRSRLSMALFCVCAMGLVVTAWSAGPLPMPGSPDVAVRHTVHVSSAITAFVSALLAMLLTTTTLWHQPILDSTRTLLVVLLTTAFLELALDPVLVPIHGALEKLVILEMITWQLVITRRLTALREDLAQAAAQAVPPDS